MDRVFRLAKEYGAAVICLTIDEEGQARTADWKLRVAKRIYDIAQRALRHRADRPHLRHAHLPAVDRRRRPPARRDGDDRSDPPHQGRMPGASTILGLSNVSFGLKPAARHVLNSVFLHECREAGLDAAIVHAARIMPLHRIEDRQREVALDLIYDRRRRELRPAHRVHGVVRRRRGRGGREGGPVGLARRGTAASIASSTATATASKPTSTSSCRRCPALEIINDVLLDGHEGRRRAVRRPARCSCRSCCSRPRR